MEGEGREDEAFSRGSRKDYRTSGNRLERQEHSFMESNYANDGMETSSRRYADWTAIDSADHTVNGCGYATAAHVCEVQTQDIRTLQLDLSKLRAEMDRLKSRCRVLEDDAIDLRKTVHDYQNIQYRPKSYFTSAIPPRNFTSSMNVRKESDRRRKRAMSIFAPARIGSTGTSMGEKGRAQIQKNVKRASRAPSSHVSHYVDQNPHYGQAQMHTNQQVEMAAMNDGEDEKRNVDTIRTEMQESAKRIRDQSIRRRRTITTDSPEHDPMAVEVRKEPELGPGAKRANDFHLMYIEKGLHIAGPGTYQTDMNEPTIEAIETDPGEGLVRGKRLSMGRKEYEIQSDKIIRSI